MAHRLDTIRLMATSPGAVRELCVHRFGIDGARPRAYLQAGLHANEIPGLLILHHLLARLMEEDRAGRVLGEIVLVPFANPIGLGDNVLGVPIGRLSLDRGMNFNRNFPELGPLVAPRLEGRLTDDADANVATIRAALDEVLAGRRPKTELDELRLALMRLAVGCDYLFDLHCEEDALFAVIAAPWVWPQLRDFACDMQPDTVFIADSPPLFDTTCSKPWHDLARHFGADTPVPQACLSATLELRGVASVDDALARRDADGLMRFLRRCGVLSGEAGPVQALKREATPFKGVEFVRSPGAGIVVYHRALGEEVEAGTVLAELVDPAAADPGSARLALRSSTDGIVFAKRHTMLVRPDDVVAKVAGARELAEASQY